MTTIRSLLNSLIPANKTYRNGSPIMTDADYDEKYDELDALIGLCDEDDTSPDVVEARAFLASIGAPPEEDSKWKEITHSLGMTSLNKAQNTRDFTSWASGLGQVGLLAVSDKADGISCFDDCTMVHLANGELMSIGEIVRQDIRPAVLSWSEAGGMGASRITAVPDNGPREDWVMLRLEDGSTITVTEDHLFYVRRKGWTPARDLLGEDLIEPGE